MNDTSIDEILLIADDSGTFNNGKLVKYDSESSGERRKSNVIRKTPMTVSAMSGGRLSKLPTPFTPRSPNPNATTTVNARLVYLSNQEQEKSKESFSLDSLQHQHQHQQKSEETNPIEKTNANPPVSSVQANIDRIRERISLITNSRNASQTSKVSAVRAGGENETSFELMQTPQPELIAEDDDDEVEKQMKAKSSSNSGKSKSHKIFDIFNCLDSERKRKGN